jgi:hypothetical protein
MDISVLYLEPMDISVLYLEPINITASDVCQVWEKSGKYIYAFLHLYYLN